MSWQRVRGHEVLVQAFAHAVRRGRLAHAYFFTGPLGVGKRRFAQELAKTLLCENRSEDRFEACDQCPACSQVEAGTHPDFFAASRPEENANMPIDVVRELCRNLALKPARGHGKVAILDDADDLDDPIQNHPAANAFLKTLEEPPPRSVLILIGADAHRQLPTIVSRCQVIRFAPLTTELVAELLHAQGIEDAALVGRLARMSGGSPGQARALADPALWNFRRILLEGLSQPRPNTVALARELMHFVEEAGKESAAKRRRAALVLRLLIDFLNQALCVSVGGTPQLAEADDLRMLRELANRLGSDQLLELLDRCLEGDVHIDRRVQLELAVEALFDSLGQKQGTVAIRQ